MKKGLLFILVLLFPLVSFSQAGKEPLKYNFDFEKVAEEAPLLWGITGSSGYSVSLDSVVKHGGKYAVRMESTGEEGSFRGLLFKLPHKFEGKNITLSGYIKTENVAGGWAGLWMNISPKIGFENMQQNGIKGTTEWQRYEISLEMKPHATEVIELGALLAGKGTMWVDDLTVTIDGVDIQALKPMKAPVQEAAFDKEFINGSRINSLALDGSNTQNLQKLGLVWGFLKYHHPAVAKGAYNWDFELFRILPQYTAATTNAERDAVLNDWLYKLGPVKTAAGARPKVIDVKFGPDIEWIKTAGFSSELTASLLKIKAAERTPNHYYIGMVPGVGNPRFLNEESYEFMMYPDAGFRLLALYRYWNIIQYYFPYKNLIEEDWKEVLQEFIPKFINAEDETAYVLATVELIARVHDTHANVWGGSRTLNNYWGKNYAPLKLNFVQDQLVVTGYHNTEAGKATGLVAGDIITRINGKPVEAAVQDLLKITPASNYSTKLRDIAPKLLRTNDSTITVEFARGGKTATTTLKTYARNALQNDTNAPPEASFRLINKDIAYINNGTIKRTQMEELWKLMQNAKGLVIDNRNYPSDFVIFNLSTLLTPRPTPFVKFSQGSITQPGLFTFTKPLTVGKRNKNHFKGKVVILVNETTQSSAEFHAMAYSVAPNATVIGSTTAAADGNVSHFMLPGGIQTMISGIGVYYPDGTETQRVGVAINQEVKPTIAGVKAGRDEVLEKALEIIRDSNR